jgi:tRNA (cmo5U34)-methyltransferase
VTDERNEWTEEDSETYRQVAAVAVPAREEQIATLLTLLPFGLKERFRTVELGCGEGALASTLLTCFPNASVLALDGSESMRAGAAEHLRSFGSRATVEPFDLSSADWHPRLEDADCVLSSLCLHHLTGEGKQRLFESVCDRLSERGALLIADVIEPQLPEVRNLFADVYDRIAEAQSVSQTGSTALFERFVAGRWNYFRLDDPDEHPSPLFDQLTWLKAAGFETVDCFRLQAGFAVFGGYKVRADARTNTISFEDALRSAQRAVRATSGTAQEQRKEAP